MLNRLQYSRTNYGGLSYNEVPRLVPIAPSISKQTVERQTEVKKKYSYKSNPYVGAQAASIARRNARERNRVKQVNDGFNALRKRLPTAVVTALSGGSRRGSGKKLSKVDTLKMVVEYIKHLQGLIEENDAEMGITKHPKINEAEFSYDIDEGFGRSSPYSESVPSPANSECSSGVSSSYSSNYLSSYVSEKQASSMYDEELLDAISWWQQK